MVWAISINCSSTDVMSVAITDIVIKKGEVKELERLEYLCSFDIPVSDPESKPVLELASVIEQGDLFPKSCSV